MYIVYRAICREIFWGAITIHDVPLEEARVCPNRAGEYNGLVVYCRGVIFIYYNRLLFSAVWRAQSLSFFSPHTLKTRTGYGDSFRDDE